MTEREYVLEEAVKSLAVTLRSAVLCFPAGDQRADFYTSAANITEANVFPPFVHPDLECGATP
jgi:hypothetical protein